MRTTVELPLDVGPGATATSAFAANLDEIRSDRPGAAVPLPAGGGVRLDSLIEPATGRPSSPDLIRASVGCGETIVAGGLAA